MNQRDRQDLDRHITGNYGEDQMTIKTPHTTINQDPARPFEGPLMRFSIGPACRRLELQDDGGTLFEVQLDGPLVDIDFSKVADVLLNEGMSPMDAEAAVEVLAQHIETQSLARILAKHIRRN